MRCRVGVCRRAAWPGFLNCYSRPADKRQPYTFGVPGTAVARPPAPAVYAAMPSSSKAKPARNAWFSRFAKWTAQHAGRPSTFLLAGLVIAAWAISGPMFEFSDTWQLVINTGTTIVTFLMVFLIQNTQNRDSQALHVKLDELIRALKGAHNSMIDLDNLTDEELERIQDHYAKLARKSKHALRELKDDEETVAAVTKKSGGR